MATVPARGFGFKIGLGMDPAENIAMPMSLDFTGADQTATKDLFQEQAHEDIPFVQSIYIDNSLNASPISIVFGGTNQKINMRANRQGYIPVCVPQGQCQFTAKSAGNVVVPILLLSMMMPYLVWDV
jgi:hypothetical protein